jgi:uncharacterized membrane protein YtjA (UPF0391 family)
MLLRREVMVGFFGFSRASAAACRLLFPECWTGAETVGASGCECSDDVAEAPADADGDATGLEVAPGETLAVGAVMFLVSCFLFLVSCLLSAELGG